MGSHLTKFLETEGIRFVRILWCDNANVIRGKAFHTDFLADHRKHGIGISMAQQAVPVMYDAVVPNSGLSPVGEVWLTPDWSTLNCLPYAPGHARVMADLIHQDKPWPLCPRSFLRRMIAAAQARGLQVMSAFENEFYLLRQTPDGIMAADDTVFASTLAMDLNQAVIDEIAEALLSQGVPVERYYPESGPGQHEIVIRYSPALQAADHQIIFRETVRGVALRHQLRASFLPKIFAEKAGSGCHLHLSLWQNGQNLFPNPDGPDPDESDPDGSAPDRTGGLSAIARAFMAGILHHLPALMAITTPTSNSYRRLQPHFWSGAFRCWGVDNREAAVRVPSGPGGTTPSRLELKTVDATANPYLALGAVIAAGLDGIDRELSPGEPIQIDPGYLPVTERQHLGVDRLPERLDQAIAYLSKNDTLLTALGPELAQAYLAVRRAEWEALKDLELPDEVNLLLERY